MTKPSAEPTLGGGTSGAADSGDGERGGIPPEDSFGNSPGLSEQTTQPPAADSNQELEQRIRQAMEQRRSRAFHWTQPEVAWPLALLPAFLIGVGVAGLGIAPLGPIFFGAFLVLLNGSLLPKGLAGTAAFASGAGTIGYALGIAGAFAALGARSSPLESLGLADQLFGGAVAGSWQLPEPILPIAVLGLSAVAVWLVAGRASGLPALLVVSAVAGEIGAAAGRFADLLLTQRAGAFGEFAAVAFGVGPFHLLELAGLACILGGRGGRTPWIAGELAERLRLTSIVGAVLVLASFALRLTFGSGWQAQLTDLLR